MPKLNNTDSILLSFLIGALTDFQVLVKIFSSLFLIQSHKNGKYVQKKSIPKSQVQTELKNKLASSSNF